MGKIRRARSEKEKIKRRQAILKTAWQLYVKTGGQLPTVASIAQKAKLSKGAVYLYFRTKEEIYLQLFVAKLEDWVESRDEDRYRGLNKGRISEDEFASLLTRYVCENPLVLKLGSIVKGVLEENTDEEIIVETKVRIAEVLSTGGGVISGLFPRIPRREAIRLMLQIYSVISGLWQFASIPAQTRRTLLKKGVDAFEIDFPDIVQRSVSALIRGTIASNPGSEA